MKNAKIVAEICEIDMSGTYTYDKRTLILIDSKFLKPKKGTCMGEVFALTEEGIEHFKGKIEGWHPEYARYYDIRIVEKHGLLERIRSLEQEIEDEENDLALLKLAFDINT